MLCSRELLVDGTPDTLSSLVQNQRLWVVVSSWLIYFAVTDFALSVLILENMFLLCLGVCPAFAFVILVDCTITNLQSKLPTFLTSKHLVFLRNLKLVISYFLSSKV